MPSELGTLIPNARHVIPNEVRNLIIAISRNSRFLGYRLGMTFSDRN